MIIRETNGDMFSSYAQAVTCPVNTVGAMGAGLAFAFKKRFPDLVNHYKQACRTKVFDSRGIYVYDLPDGSNRKIVCLPTKHHWEQDADLALIERGLIALARDHKEYGLESLAMPAIGCGKGKLEWGRVRPLILKHLGKSPLRVELYTSW